MDTKDEALDDTLDAATLRRVREYLCFSHGHTGQYGDDGELQCCQCAPFGAVDYRRESIARLLDVIDAGTMARLIEQQHPKGPIA